MWASSAKNLVYNQHKPECTPDHVHDKIYRIMSLKQEVGRRLEFYIDELSPEIKKARRKQSKQRLQKAINQQGLQNFGNLEILFATIKGPQELEKFISTTLLTIEGVAFGRSHNDPLQKLLSLGGNAQTSDAASIRSDTGKHVREKFSLYPKVVEIQEVIAIISAFLDEKTTDICAVFSEIADVFYNLLQAKTTDPSGVLIYDEIILLLCKTLEITYEDMLKLTAAKYAVRYIRNLGSKDIEGENEALGPYIPEIYDISVMRRDRYTSDILKRILRNLATGRPLLAERAKYNLGRFMTHLETLVTQNLHSHYKSRVSVRQLEKQLGPRGIEHAVPLATSLKKKVIDSLTGLLSPPIPQALSKIPQVLQDSSQPLDYAQIWSIIDDRNRHSKS